MYTEIYGDIYIIINMTMDYAALFITSVIMKHPQKQLRMLLSSFAGGVYALLQLFIPEIGFLDKILTLLICFLMSYISFGKRKLILSCAVFSGASFLLGGMMTFVFFFIKRNFDFSGSDTGGFFFCAFACSLASLILSRISERNISKEICNVFAEQGGISFKAEGLIDSGNLLREPISGAPVIIICKSLSERFLPDDFSLSGGHGEKENLFCNNPLGMRIRLVPCSALGKGKGMLVSFIPDKCTLDGVDVRCVVALCDEESFGGYQVLVPSCAAPGRRGQFLKKRIKENKK